MKRSGRVKQALLSFGSHLSSDQTGSVSPWRLFIIIIASIFVSEIVAMIVVYFLEPIPYFLTTLIDAGIMVVLICPILYLFSFRPLIQYVESLRQSEQKVDLERRRLQSILDAMPYGIYIVNQQYDVEYSNPAIEREFGLLEGQKCYSYLHDQNEVCAWCKNLVVFDGKSTHWEWVSPKTGKNYEAFDTPLANLDGTLSKLKIIHNITERKRSQETVILLSSVVEQTADTVVVTDCDGVIQYVNPAFEQLTGYSKEEAIGQTPRVLRSGIHDRQFYKDLWETVLHGDVFHGEISNRKKNGDIFHEVKTITPLRNERGDIVRFVATGKDITEHKVAEQRLYKAYAELELRIQERTLELRYANSELEAEINERLRAEAELRQLNETLQMQAIELEMQADELKAQKGELIVANEQLRVSEERLGRAQEIAHLGSWELDLVTNKLTWSDEVYRIFGLQPQEFGATYEAFLEAIHPDDREAVNEAYSSSIRDGRDTYEIEHRIVKRSTGEIRIVHEKCEHFRNEAGEIVRSIGMVHDITIRKKAEEALQRFQLLSEHSRDIILFMRFQDGHILEANAAAVQAYGLSHDELLALSISDLRGANSNKLTAEQMAQANDRGILFETIHRRKDGSSFPVEVSSQGATIAGVRTLVSIVRDITDRKQAEEQLERSNQKLNEILTSIQDDFYVLDRDWNFVFTSRLFTEKIGKEPEDFVGNNIWMMFPKHVGTVLEENFRAAMEKREVRRFELGEKYTSAWYRMTAFPSTEGITVLGEDITQLKQAEDARRLSEENFSKAFKSSPAALMITRLSDGQFMELNDAYCTIVGFDRDELIGRRTTDFNIYMDEINEKANVDQLLMGGSIRDFETSIRHRSGAIRSAVTAQELITFNGEACILSSLRDVTKRRQAEAALQKSEAMLRTVLDQMPSGVTVRDAFTGKLILSNVRGREILGGLVDTADQFDQYHGVYPDGRPYPVEEWPLSRSIATGEIIDGEEIEIRRSSGTRVVISISSAPVRDSLGQIVSGVSIFHDITERKKAEKELHQLNRTLRAHSASNQAMLRARNEAELLNAVCRIVVEDCGHAMVWIGYAEDDEEKSVRPVANAGFEAGYLETLKISWADTERGRGPTGIAIRTGKAQGCRNMLTEPQFAPWREQALQRGYASSLVLPLKANGGRAFGALTIYSRQPESFYSDEQELLTDLASDLAHGIEMIRLREAHERITAALRESEERFRLALIHAPVTVSVQDRDLRYTWAYNQRTRLVEEIIGKTDFDLFPSEAEKLIAIKRCVIETGENASEQLWVNSNTQRLFLDLFIEPLKNEMGEIEGIGLATVDLTPIKLAEEALRESETKYRNLFENMTEEVHFWQLMRDGSGCIKTWRLVDANPPTLKSWGWSTIEEIRGKTTEEIFGPGATDHYMPIVQKIMTDGAAYSYEDYFPNLDKYFRFTSVPFGEHFITTGADITISKKAEQALRRAHDELEIRVWERTEELATANRELSNEITERREIERQLRIQTAAMEAAANGIMITDPEGFMLWTNPAMAQISGYSHDELIGQNTRLFNSGKNEPDFYSQMWGTILAGNVWRGETTNRRKDGSLYIEEQTITPVRNEAGLLSHFIAIKQDVTERKLIYAQLEASNQELITLSDSERQQRFLAEGLVESSVALNMSLELNAVLDRIFEQTRRIIPYLTADIVLIENDVATIVRQWWSDEYSHARTIFENDSLKIHEFPIWERICGTKSAVMVADTGSEDHWNSNFGMAWIRSYLGAPLIYNDQIIGIINLISDQADIFQEDMVKTLQAFAAPAAVAIQNARLYENEQQNRKIAEILSAASVALAQTLDTQMVMETILDYVRFVMPFDVAFVVLNEGDERYRIRAARAGDDNIALRNSLLDQTIDMLTEPIIRSYFTKYESTYIPDSDELSAWHPPLELASMRCWLGIPLESMGKVLGIVVIVHESPAIFTKNQIQLVETVVKQAVVALQNAWLFEQVRSGRERLQQLSRHLVEIQENERKYIARELHDETSQSLTSLKMGLQVIEREADRRVRLTKQVRNLQVLADETLESLHHLAVNLRPASLDHLGLTDALESLIESTKQRSELQAHFKIIGSMQVATLTDEIETSIYRIVQESITNVIRHAHATYVDVILEWQNEKILVVIEDDGVGMDIEKARETGRLGLIGMQERAEMLGGSLLVESSPQVGTTLVVEIPYGNSNPYRR